jgi:ribosomal protein L7/L12
MHRVIACTSTERAMPTCDFCNASVATGCKICPKCGAALFLDDATEAAAGKSPETDDDLLSLIRKGRKIDAIKRYRAQTGAGLAEAKEAVEAMERGEPPPPSRDAPAPDGIDAELWELLKNGRKIEAIKRFRAQTGAGLAEAKTAVEAIARRHGLAATRSGCAGMLLLGVVGVAGAAWLFS